MKRAVCNKMQFLVTKVPQNDPKLVEKAKFSIFYNVNNFSFKIRIRWFAALCQKYPRVTQNIQKLSSFGRFAAFCNILDQIRGLHKSKYSTTTKPGIQ